MRHPGTLDSGTTGCSAVWLARRVWVAEVAGSNPASPTRWSSRFGEGLVHVLDPALPPHLSWARTRADASPRFRGNVLRKCVWSRRRVGWPSLTCGRDRNGAASAQVKAKREDLTSEVCERAMAGYPLRRISSRDAKLMATEASNARAPGSFRPFRTPPDRPVAALSIRSIVPLLR
jgi:hypothetical protein